jgi:sigma-B regulation protein RsbU (phosphoserine phosphatase)
MANSSNDSLHGFLAAVQRWVDHVVPRTKSFWQRVTDGLELQELWESFRSEARASYSLYAREVDWETFRQQKKSHQIWHVARAFFWAMILKLSPARRVFLLLALVLTVFGLLDVKVELGDHSSFVWNGQPFFILAALALLLLLALELADRVTMKRDLEIAREIQRRLVPAAPPQIAGFDIAFATRPANTVAGDYYDAFLRVTDAASTIPPRLFVVVADVAGKSIPAAMVMATLQASLRTLALEPTPLLHLVTGLNHYACEHGGGGQRFITAFLAEIDTATRAVTYVNAGHNLPILRRASGSIERLGEGGLPFGIKNDAVYASGSATLGAGDLLVIFTDGVVEAENEAREEFGDQRLLELYKAPPQGSSANQLTHLMTSLDGFVSPGSMTISPASSCRLYESAGEGCVRIAFGGRS